MSFFLHLHYWLCLDLGRMSAWKAELVLSHQKKCRTSFESFLFVKHGPCEGTCHHFSTLPTFGVLPFAFTPGAPSEFHHSPLCSNRCLPVSHESEGGKLRGEEREGGGGGKKRGAFVFLHWKRKKRKTCI